jgi:hypothetical protein
LFALIAVTRELLPLTRERNIASGKRADFAAIVYCVPMAADHETLLQRLAKAEEQVELGAHNVTRQREIVAQLERDGFDTVGARALLIEFEEAQTAYVAERDRLRREVQSRQGVGRG